MVGDGSVVTRITAFYAQGGSDEGVMLRTGPTPTSGMVFVGIENGAAMLKWRNATGQAEQGLGSSAVGTPYWFRLTRAGNAITAYMSPNGTDWTAVGTPQTITDAGTTMYAGLAAAGWNCCNLVTAAFDHVTVTGGNGSGTADFTLAAPTATQLVDAGESVSVPVTVNVTGQFNGPVTLSVYPATLPAGMTASFGPTVITGAGESTLILTAGPTATGNFTMTVNGVSGSLSHSTQVQLTVNAAAAVVALPATVPATGMGGAFGFAASDPGGNGGNISWMEVLVNGTPSGSQACYLHYDRVGQTLYLRDDANPSWVASAAMPMTSNASLGNSQCTVTGATGTVSGGTLSFTRAFAGAQNIYELTDTGNLNGKHERGKHCT
jgi:hypothetical protein